MTNFRAIAPAILAVALTLSGCAAVTSTPAASTGDTPPTDMSAESPTTSFDTSAVVGDIAWADSMTVTVDEGSAEVIANGIPNHGRDEHYAVPGGGGAVPDASTAQVVDDPTQEQDYDFTITTTPTYVDEVTAASLGAIGIMISGSVLFNPYEGDGTTVAMANNFSVTANDGTAVWFVDSCTGHPTPMSGEYHYHGLSSCVASEVDTESEPSHIIGLALDGFPIYGANDIDGNPVEVSTLDDCNGITSPTPEFPDGIYHYVLPGTSDETSSMRCFHGEVDSSQMRSMPPMTGMPGIGGMGG